MCRFRLMMHEDRSAWWCDCRRDDCSVGTPNDDDAESEHGEDFLRRRLLRIGEWDFSARRNAVVKIFDATAAALVRLDGGEISADVAARFFAPCENAECDNRMLVDAFSSAADEIGEDRRRFALWTMSVDSCIFLVCDERAPPIAWLAEENGDAYVLPKVECDDRRRRHCRAHCVCVPMDSVSLTCSLVRVDETRLETLFGPMRKRR